MNQITLNALEFNKIRKIISTFTSSQVGSQKAHNILPSKTPEEIKKSLQLVEECMMLFQAEGELNFSGAKEIGYILDKVRITGTVLEVFDILQIAQNIKIALQTKSRIKKSSLPLPSMKQLAELIPDLNPLLKQLTSKIDPGGEILDNASPKLRTIRRNLRSAKKRIQSALQSMLESQNLQKFLQESLITIRNERFVIPIKAEFKGVLDGVVQDKSTSGATVFIEPLSVIEDNNRLAELKAEERAEVIKILSQLTELIRTEGENLRQVEDLIGELDLLSAEAKFGLKLKCTIPRITENGSLAFSDARHPLLDQRLRENMLKAGISIEPSSNNQNVVPISLKLSQKENTVIITGPNTGGKTVALKTIGLLAMMSQSGIPLPAMEVELPAFQSIFADIGDQQSIEQNLSTFSAHLNNIINMIKEVEQPALVLLDEIGAGTDPSEGAALGLALIDYFHKLGSLNLISTHHNAIKIYAYSQEGISNASVEFDEETLRPTYKLIQGIPGRSNALKIAKRLGLPQDLLIRAEHFFSEKDSDIDQFIKKLEEKYTSLEQQENWLKKETLLSRQREEKLLQSLGKTIEREEELANRNLNQWQEIKEAFKVEARTLLEELKLKAENTELIKQARKKIEILISKYENQLPKGKKRKTKKLRFPRYLFKGDTIRVVSLNQIGTVCQEWQKRNNKDILLAIKKKKIWVRPEDAELISRAAQDKSVESMGRVEINVRAKSRMSGEINLHGCTIEEALSRTDKFLDDALLAQLSRVRIVHGIGKGKLRNAIGEHLKKQSFVQNFRPADQREGGEGVTVVELAV